MLMALAMSALEFTTNPAQPGFEVLRWSELLVMVGVYWRGYALVQSTGSRALPTVVVFAGIFALLALWLPPFELSDLRAYANDGWMQHHYGLNPYTRLISAAPGWQHDPMFTQQWEQEGCVYGFLFALLTRGIATIGGGHLALTVLLFKVTSVAGYAATAILIRAIAARIALARVDLALYLYLWSPLIVVHELANGHNDLVAALFVMLSIWFAAAELPFMVLPMLIASAMIKPLAEVILPFGFLYVARRSGLFRALVSTAAAAALFIACSIPYRGDWTPLPRKMFLRVLFGPNYSLASSAYWMVAAANKLFSLGAIYRWASDASIVVFLFAGGFLLAAALVRFAANSRPTVHDLAAVAVLAQAILILVATANFGPWYLAAILPTALVLAPGHWLRRLALALSISWMWYFTALGDLRILNALIMTGVPMVWICFEQWADVKSTFIDVASFDATVESARIES
jgi:hypothetical protein